MREDRSMPAFRKPSFDFDWDAADEVKALRDYPKLPDREDRAIPAKQNGRLLLATCNIATLGLQKRRDKDHQLLAEVISWFDLIVLQEVNDDLAGLRGIQDHLPKRYRILFSDPGGNNERYT